MGILQQAMMEAIQHRQEEKVMSGLQQRLMTGILQERQMVGKLQERLQGLGLMNFKRAMMRLGHLLHGS